MSNQFLMVERSACGVQSIICIHCNKKNEPRHALPDMCFWRFMDGRGHPLSSCRESLGVGRPLRPVAFVGAPQVDVAEAEGTPPGVQHLPVEAEDAFAGNTFRRRSEPGEAVIEAGAISIAHAR